MFYHLITRHYLSPLNMQVITVLKHCKYLNQSNCVEENLVRMGSIITKGCIVTHTHFNFKLESALYFTTLAVNFLKVIQSYLKS